MSLSKLPLVSTANVQLQKFADDQKAAEEFHDMGIQLCEQVRKHLQSVVSIGSKPFSINSTFYGGSIGKHTDVQNPDFDIVMKITDQLPPFKEVLSFFEKTLKRNAVQLNIKSGSFRVRTCSIQFTFSNGIEVDLLPAVADLTEDEILQKMKKLPLRHRRYYSSSLVEKQVEFMKRQDAFTHAVVRLAKVWFKSMDFGGAYVCGGSTIFESLAVAAVSEERRRGGGGQDSIVGSFGRLIDYVEKLDHLRLAFEKCYYNSSCTWNIKYGPAYGHQAPYVLEPANPSNNLLRNMRHTIKAVLKKNGKMMRRRMEKMLMLKGEEFWKKNASNEIVIDYEKLFQTVSL